MTASRKRCLLTIWKLYRFQAFTYASDCRAVVLKVENAALADAEQGDLRMNELTPFNMMLHPEGRARIVGTGSAGLTVLDITQQDSNPPTLSFAQGQTTH